MRKLIVFFFPALVSTHAPTDYWIQPDKFVYKRIEPINIRFVSGENFAGRPWDNDRQSVRDLSLYFEDVEDRTLYDDLGDGKGDSLQLSMIDEGTVVLALDAKNSSVSMEGQQFDDYLQDNGFTDAIDFRSKNRDSTSSEHLDLHRSLKTIFQVGNRFTPVFKKNTGLPIDINPLDHPYNIERDGHLKFQARFMGEKLTNTKVKVWHRVDQDVSERDYTTNDDGEVKIFISPEGEWMISCAHIITPRDHALGNWQVYSGSLTWGYY